MFLNTQCLFSVYLVSPNIRKVLYFIHIAVSARISLCVSDWPGICCVDHAGLKLTEIYLPLKPECWD